MRKIPVSSQERENQSKESFQKAGRGYQKVGGIKELPAALWYTLKGAFQKFDSRDKKIGENIEEKKLKKGKDTTGTINTLLRNNILKLAMLLALSGTFGGIKISENIEEKKENQKELVMDEKFAYTIEEQEKIIKDFFSRKDIIKDIEGSGKKLQQEYYNKYVGKDKSWLKERKKVIEGFMRMVESGDLEMVLKKADEAGVPRQCVFLALAESRREYGANSGKAGGPRQFTKGSAILFGLNERGGKDNRKDPVKSTEAAMRHLIANYEKVEELWGKNKKLTESDKWMLAFYMYNGSPDLVTSGYNASKGNLNEYPIKQKSKENRKYVPRILAIQDALKQIFQENNYDINKIMISIGSKTIGDIMYEEYKTKIGNKSDKEKIEELEKIKKQYEEEFNSGLIKEKYYNGAKSVIEAEITRLGGTIAN